MKLAVVVILIVIVVAIVILIRKSNSNATQKPGDKRLVDAVKCKLAVKNEHYLIEQKIPKKIMQTNETDKMPVGMLMAAKSIMEQNPEYEYRYFDDESAREFLIAEYGPRVIAAYDDLIPGAFKADFFRYCYLYKVGGVYLDTGMVAVRPLREMIKATDEFISPEDNGSAFVFNAFMVVTANHPIIGKAIEYCLHNIEFKDKTDDMLNVTGPGLLGKAFRNITGHKPKFHTEYGNGVRLVKHLSAGVLSDQRGEKVSSGEIIVESDETFFQTKYAAYADERKWYNTKAHYGELWWSDKVFYSALDPDPQVAKCPKKVAPPVEEQILMRIVADIVPAVTATSEQLIPRIIMQTNESYDVPKKMYDAMMSVSGKNPDYQYIYFDSERRKQYIIDNFGSEMLEVYDTLIPGAFKADLFRYCFLLKTGGVYVDSGMVAKLPLSSLIKPDDQFLAPEDDGGKRVCNGFMCVAPNHPILQLTIDRVVENVRTGYYGQSSLQITGPILMGDVFFKVVKRKADAETDYANGVRLISHLSARTISGDVCVSPGEIRAGGQLFFMTKYPLYHLDMLWYHTKEHYDTLWNIRQIYNN